MSQERFAMDNVTDFLMNMSTTNAVHPQAVSGSKINNNQQSDRIIILHIVVVYSCLYTRC